MKTHTLERELKKMNKEQRKVFEWACDKFKKSPTYFNYHRNLRTALMYDYGFFTLKRYNSLRDREKQEYKEHIEGWNP